MNSEVLQLTNRNISVTVYNYHEIGYIRNGEKLLWHELWRSHDGGLWIHGTGFEWIEVSILDYDKEGLPVVYEVVPKPQGRKARKKDCTSKRG